MKTGSNFALFGVSEPSNKSHAYGPPVLVPFCRRPVGITPGVGGIVESAKLDDRPVQKIIAWIVCVLVAVEHVDDGKLADGYHDAIRGLAATELVEVWVKFFRVAPQLMVW